MKYALTLTLVFILGAVAVIFLKNKPTDTVGTPVYQVASSQPLNISFGNIEGTLSYPSEQIPKDMTICAENLQKQQVGCTSDHIQIPNTQNGYGLGFSLVVPSGEYYVYAYLETNPTYKAYYNEFVTCGLSVECQSHEPIVVKVNPGETVKDIKPHDWYQF